MHTRMPVLEICFCFVKNALQLVSTSARKETEQAIRPVCVVSSHTGELRRHVQRLCDCEQIMSDN